MDGRYGFVKDGKPVYPDYNDTTHCVEVEPVSSVPIRRGWDFGLTPACVLTQVTPLGQVIIFDELTSEDLGIDKFSDAVLMHCAERYGDFEFEDYGDPAGDSRSPTDERTCFEILRAKGIRIRASEQDLAIRLESVKKGLNTLNRGIPQLALHPRCKMLRKGFQGRYRYKRMKISGTEERHHDKPDKNAYSHPHDALQYVAVKVFEATVRSRARYQRERYVDPPHPRGWMNA